MNQRLPFNKLVACFFSSVLVYTFLMTSSASAQIAGVDKGERIRITAPTIQPGKIKGSIDSFSASTITLSVKDSSLVIPYVSIQKAEIVNGRKRNTGRGALIGAPIGALALGIISAVSNEPCDDESWCFFEMSDAEAFGFGALVGALGGAINGAIIGTFVKTDRFEEVPVQISAAVFPTDGSNRIIGPKLVFKF